MASKGNGSTGKVPEGYGSEVIRSRFNHQTGTNIVTVRTGKGREVRIACLGIQSERATTGTLAALLGTPEALGHATNGNVFPKASTGKPAVYIPASWCDGCKAILAARVAAGEASVAATATVEAPTAE